VAESPRWTGSDYVGGGVQVINASNPTQPRRIGGNSAFHPSDITVAGNNVFVAAGQQGLMILDLFRPPPCLRLRRSREIHAGNDDFDSIEVVARILSGEFVQQKSPLGRA
jgi:hypothetical protein